MEKPLPPTPPHFDRTKSEVPGFGTPSTLSETPMHNSTLSASSPSSFQRPKKRVIWRNKGCMIALPIDNEFGKETNRESYLSPEDVVKRQRAWEDQGYDIKGFILARASSGTSTCITEGQSRPVHPDPEDEKREREERIFRVNVPDLGEWEAYVNYLKEEKLRALGVSSGDEEPPRKSPAPFAMSRDISSQSSAFITSPGLAPAPVSSTPSAPGLPSGNNPSNHRGKAEATHFPRYSTAMPIGEKPIALSTHPPPSYSPTQSNSSVNYHLRSQPGSRVASPMTNLHTPPINGALSLVPLQIQPSQASMQDSWRRQEALFQGQQMQHPLQSYYPSVSHVAPIAPRVASDDFLASPIPRGNRQNPSENLQREIDEARTHHSPHKDEGGEALKLMRDQQNKPVNHFLDSLTAEGSKSLKDEINPSQVESSTGTIKDHGNPNAHKDLSKQEPLAKVNSKLNANAPEFRFGGKALATQLASPNLSNQLPAKAADIIPDSSLSNGDNANLAPNQTPQHNKFNVDAPEFTPAANTRKAMIPSREFSFSAQLPTNRPNAPSSETSGTKAVLVSDYAYKDNPVEAVRKIFGEVQFPEVIKPANESKAVPIIKPSASSVTSGNDHIEPDGQEDESGRITQADGRQKRMRRDFDDGDQIPLFAFPKATPWIYDGRNEKAVYFSRTPSPQSEQADPATIEAATELLEELIDDLSATEASELMRDDESRSGDDELFEPHKFHDINDAATFNTARPRRSSHEADSQRLGVTPEDIAQATVNFLGKSPQFKADFNEALERRSLNSRSPRLPEISQDQSFDEPVHRDGIDRIDYARQDIMLGVRYVEPSYHELDAIMRHLNEDSDRGIERQPSPFKRRGQSISPVRSSAPEHYHASRSPVRDSIQELYSTPHISRLLPATTGRSNAPSPSPNRLREPIQYLPQTDSESANTSAVENIERIAREIADNPLNSPSWPSRNAIPVHHLNSPGSTPPSDWNDALSPVDEEKFHSRSGFFDQHVNEIVGGVVQQRLDPIEHTLSSIQQTLVALSSRSASRRPRSSETIEVANSDADDEEDSGEMSQSRLKSPLKDRKYDQLKSTISEITAAQQNFASATQLEEVMVAIKEIKSSVQEAPSNQNGDVKTIVDEAIGRHLRGRSAPVTSSSVAAVAEKSQLQIAGLESMLKIAEARADEELKARRSTEDALAESQRSLQSALRDAAEQHESAEATEQSLQGFSGDRQEMLQRILAFEESNDRLENTISQYMEKNTALEDTLAEYRLSHDQWRTEIDDARHENKDLRRHLKSMKDEIDEANEGRHSLRTKFDGLQESMAQTLQDAAAEQLRQYSKEAEHSATLNSLSSRLEVEARTRERLELEIERLETREKEIVQSQVVFEQTQKANSQLQSIVDELRNECSEQQKLATRSERELQVAKEAIVTEVDRVLTAMGHDLEHANNQLNLVRAELETVTEQSRKQLKDAAESQSAALEKVADAQKAALEEHSRVSDRTMVDLRSQHDRALNNALEDKERSETYFGNRLNLADEKVEHYKDRETLLEEKLEIAKSAARAAAQAAQAKKGSLGPTFTRNLPSFNKISSIPEKISPQALRESILVLQEQLQERESRIEQLESELSSTDSDAPAKLKDAEIEITWLRELLGVRYDDLQDIITTLSQPSYDREAVKDAAIRLKANLQMEQQEKERAFAGSQTFPSLNSITSLAASPRALPLAAAAAWGNWRKNRDTGIGNVNPLSYGSVQQTPSKSSPQSFFAGLMTPPSTNMRTTPPVADNPRPLSSSSTRASRLPSTPKQNPSSRKNVGLSQDPVTPPLMRKTSYDLDASESMSGFGDEGIEGSRMAREDEEPFGPKLGGIVEAR